MLNRRSDPSRAPNVDQEAIFAALNALNYHKVDSVFLLAGFYEPGLMVLFKIIYVYMFECIMDTVFSK